MEVELEPRVKPLSYKVKGISRESPAQKAANVLDNDLRNHWSTGTNTKEWILLELDEPCLLSHIRIYNKSVLEWEISVGLRYKPETFIKVRPRCEAPRRDMVYPMNYSPCRYVRISCLRGNPIAIFFIQLIGVSVTGLEPEFQPVVNHLLPHIISQKQDTHDMHLQLLQDITNRLVTFLPQFEVDLNSFSEAAEPTLRFLAMLSGPFYPILRIVNERETTKISGNLPDSEASKNGQLSVAFTVSSNFEPRRLRNASVSLLPISSELIFRPDVVFTLLRKAYKDPNLGKVCRMVSSILLKLTEAVEQEVSSPDTNVTPDEASKSEPSGSFPFVDYSNLFGEEFLIPDGNWETSYLHILDTKLVEEGLLHVLYASASQPLLCSKLADSYSDLWLALPLIQALVPALRPNVSSPDQIDENFSQWKQPLVQHALSEIVATSSSVVFRPLLRACAGYLSSFSPSHAKAACVLIDLCSGVLAPWLAQVIAKVDLAVELLEDLFGDIQGARSSFAHSRAALKYIVLALSGNMDDVMAKYKDVKHQILFLVEMLEPFLDPAMTPVKSIISFGNVSSTFFEKQEQNCAIALNVLRTAVSKPAVLPSLEAEWRRGSVSPSILLSILEPHMQLPPDIDLRKYSTSRMEEIQSSVISSQSSAPRNGGAFSKSNSEEDAEGRTDNSDVPGKTDFPEEASFLFAPSELSTVSLTYVSGSQNGKNFEINHSNVSMKGNDDELKNSVNHLCDNFTPNSISTSGYSGLMADYFQLKNYSDSELKAPEFRRFALDLHSQTPLTPEGHSAAIDALLLAAECHVNPFFMMSFQDTSQAFSKENVSRSFSNWKLTDIRKVLEKDDSDLKLVADLERERDKAVLEILLEAAELDRKYQKISLDTELAVSYAEENEEVIKLSQDDVLSADAITLVRQNQKLLCNFLIQQLQRDQQSMHEILLQSLLFLLHSATKLFCAPELVVDIVLKSAEYFSVLLKSLYYQFKEGSLQLSHLKLHEVQRRWMLLQRLVIASSGSDEESNISVNVHNGFRFANLIPPSAWLQKISKFASSSFPLVRYLGWMAVSRNAKQYLKERLFLASDLTQLTFLLSIFSDELALVDNIVKKEDEKKKDEEPRVKEDVRIGEGFEHPWQQYDDQSFTAIYPDICQFFPNLKKHFESFGESILEAVGLQLKSLSSASVPDLMCWFSDLCSWPFLQKRKDLKGFAAKNAKAVIRFILESVLSEHMEAMVPEIPRLVQVLSSLCSSSYSDVSFLDSILHLLKPLFSYSLHKAFKEENLSSDYPCLNFESLCFNELLGDLKDSGDGQGHAKEYGHRKALIVFVLASVLPDLSFHCKTEILQSSLSCADFASYEATTSFHDYLCAYQTLMGSCKSLLVQLMRDCGAIPVKKSLDSDANIASCDDCFQSCSWFLLDVCHSATEVSEKLDSNNGSTIHMSEKVCPFSTEEIEIFLKELDDLIDKLNPTVDLCYKVHHKLARKLTLTSAECFIYSKFLSSIEKNLVLAGIEKENLLQSNFVDQFLTCWNFGLEEFAEKLLVLQEKHCWEAASVFLDCLLSVPRCFCLDSVINKICSAIKNFSCNAPNISWRLQTDRWMSSLLRRGVHLLHRNETPFVDLFCSMLKHPEPEQRFIAVKHLRRLVGHDVEGETTLLSLNSELAPSAVTISSSLSISSTLVCSTWDQVVYLASSDTSLLLRTHSMALLLNYIPLAGRQKLQSLLAAADSILQSLTNLVQPTCEGPIPKFSLALLANICLHTPAEDISLIPDIIWSSIESFGMLENERCPVGPERKVCKALCRLRTEEDEAKQMLREVLSSSSSEPPNPDFGSTRESILQVISNFTSVQSYFDLFSKETDKKALELEEAEIEMELLQKEHALQDSSNNIKDLFQLPFLADGVRDDNRLQQIKDGIRSLEKTKLREEIIARRQKKTLLRHARQKFLEDAALQEAEHLQELDRERTSEVEREIERQRLVELERAKTRELQHNLDMEREKQAQRELQRELEHVESGGGTRASRREYPSSAHSRSRYRERENGRASNEIRASGGGAQPDTGMSSSPIAAVPKVVLSGGRQFSGQVPTILQSQERSDEYGSGYEENFDGSKDSGDTGSVGDPDVVSAFEGQSLAFSSTLRHGSRGSKSRQILERKERDRRESKWERKH